MLLWIIRFKFISFTYILWKLLQPYLEGNSSCSFTQWSCHPLNNSVCFSRVISFVEYLWVYSTFVVLKYRICVEYLIVFLCIKQNSGKSNILRKWTPSLFAFIDGNYLERFLSGSAMECSNKRPLQKYS